jgi:riboflavin kinase / FMN adenylyltransferase
MWSISMRILDVDQVLPPEVATVVTVGNFDGVHRGHALLMTEMVEKARASGLKSAVVTFEPHTRVVLNPELSTERLTTFEEKAYLIEQCGIDYLLSLPFTPEFSRLSPEHFVRTVLSERLHASEWIMGEGHGVGKDRSGSKNVLPTILSKYHIMMFTADLLKSESTIISSTQVRANIVQGRLSETVEMLGHPYLISAERIKGLKIGSQLGFPTLNFSRPPSQKVLPPPGVYAAELEYKSSVQAGALYFGDCPTFTGRSSHFEFYAFGTDKPFPEAGEIARLWIHSFIRADKPFETTGALVAQIENDVKTIQNFFRGERSCH